MKIKFTARLDSKTGSLQLRHARSGIHQTAATIQCSKKFGIASKAAKILRQHFAHQLPYPADKNMQRHFTGAINKWLGTCNVHAITPQQDLGYIQGFAFNEASSTAALCKVPFTITQLNDGLLRLQLPAFVPALAILAPEGTANIRCAVTAASWNWNNPNLQNSARTSFQIPFTNGLFPAQDIQLAVPASPGCLLVTIVSIEFYNARGERDNRYRYLPCNVVDARYC